MPRLYLVRHAEPAALWGAHPDPGLSELGHEQARFAAARLRALSVGNLITSPLARCRETAAALEVELGLEASINRAVAEIPVPQTVTEHRPWLMAVMGGIWSADHVDPMLRQWRDEITEALVRLTQDTIIFSHFVAINAAVGTAMQSDQVTVFKPGHASITVLETTGKALKVLELGQESAIHLA
jgi:broad specificity phosphatase PhoE